MPTEGRDRFSRSQYGPVPAGRSFLGPLDRARRGPLQPQDLRAGVGQHHAGVGRRTDARQLNDLDPAQRSTAVGHRRIVTRAAHDGQAHPPAPSWGRARCPRPWTSHHHRRPHRLQRRTLAAHGHRAGHRGRLHAEAGQLPLRDRLGPVPGPSGRDHAGRHRPGARRRPPWRPGSCACRTHRAAASPGSPARSRSAPACPRAPPSRWRCCSPSATTPIPWRWPGTARRPSAAPGAHVGPARSPRHRRRHRRARAPIDFATLKTHPVPVPEEAAFVHRAQRGAPPAHRHPLRRPARRVRAGRAHSGPAARSVRARRPERAHRPRSAPAGPARHHRVRPGARGRAPAGPRQPRRTRRRHDRGTPQPGRRLPGLRAGGRPAGGAPARVSPASSAPA